SILFSNSAVLQDMTAYIDSGERLNIYKPLKNKNIFTITKYIFADFSGIFLVFVGLLALFYGSPAYSSQEYLKTLASIAGKKNLFLNTLLARAILLTLYNLLFLFLAVLLIDINGVSIDIDKYLVLFFLEMCGVTAFFLVLGSAFGSIGSVHWGQRGIIISWLILLLILPFLLDLIVSVNAATIKPETQLEIEKLKLMMDFEKNSNQKAGILELNQKPADIDRELVESYYKNEFQKMQALEDLLNAQMQDCKKMHYLLSSFFPTTFYQSLTNELSSKGYETLEDFYNTVKQIKEAFFKEYIKQVYFLPQPTKAEPFLKDDDNIYIGKPALPGYLLLGFCFNLIWIVALALIAYYGFKKVLFTLPEKKKNDPDIREVKLDNYNINSFQVSNDLLTRLLYNFLSDETAELKKRGYSLKVTVNDLVLNMAEEKKEFFYLCHPSELPGHVKTGNYLNLVMNLMKIDKAKRREISSQDDLTSIWSTKLSRLDNEQMGYVYRALLEMKRFPIYLFGDTGRKMMWEFCHPLVEEMLRLCSDETIIIHLYEGMEEILFKNSKSCGFIKNKIWIDHVLSVKEKLNG
ncbi:MAG: transporter permease subunit, partial [Acidobacteriota bacterium]|nr:transporter permease subunit [Acidobacteriota bacterium]